MVKVYNVWCSHWGFGFQPAPTAQFGHYYNLTKRMEAEKVNGAGIDCLSFTDLLAYEREQ